MSALTLEQFAEQAKAALATRQQSDVRMWLLAQPGLIQRWGTWVEFGVAGGDSLSTWAQHRGRAELWGFDSFRGLPEAWNAQHPRGKFAMDRPPMPPEGVRMAVGLFEETLPSWKPSEPITFVHIDCDLYSSAESALYRVWPRLANRSVILLDDCLTEPFDNGVLRALYVREHRAWEWLVRDRDTDTAAILVHR